MHCHGGYFPQIAVAIPSSETFPSTVYFGPLWVRNGVARLWRVQGLGCCMAFYRITGLMVCRGFVGVLEEIGCHRCSDGGLFGVSWLYRAKSWIFGLKVRAL